MSLRTKIIMFVGVITVALLGTVAYYLQYTVRQSFKDEVKANMVGFAEINKHTYLASVESLKTRAIDWSSGSHTIGLIERVLDKKSSLTARAAATREFGAYFRDYKMPYAPNVLLVDVLDADGKVVASTRDERIGTDEREEEIKFGVHHFSKSISSKLGEALVRSSVFEADESSKPMSHVTVRMFSSKKDEKGNFIPLPAVLLVHFVSDPSLNIQQEEGNLDSGILAQQTLTGLGDSDVYFVNSDKIVVSPLESGGISFFGKSIDTKPVRDCFERESNTVGQYFNYQGIKVLGVAICIPEDGVLLLNEVDVKNAYAFLDNLVQKTVLGGGALVLLLIVFVLIVSQRPLKNILLMVDAAKAVSTGNFTKRVLVNGRDEIGYLAKMFNTMLETIATSQEKLKQSEKKLADEASQLVRDLQEHEDQAKFVEQSKRATQNLLEDAWEIKEKLEVERNRLQTILSSIGDGLVLIDGHYIITLVNPRAVELFAIPAKELLGKDLRLVMKLLQKKKGELSPGQWPIEEMFLTKHIVTTDLEDELSLMTEKRTAPLPVALSVAPLGGESSVGAGGVIVIRDVTEDRELDEAKSGFISVASHQLRTPLTTIRWYSEMLLSDDAGTLTKDQREFLSEIHGGAERLYQTIDLLLGISRVESGKLKAENKPIDLTSFIAELEKELAPQMIEKKLVFSAVPPPGDPVIVSLDPLTLRQVVLNLISNAIRYTNENGTIEARWVVNNERTEVTYAVKDNGIGIPVAQRGRIFSKFFRAENALSKVPDGSGLGLALVKELVVAWGGKVWFEVEDGKGTTFFFTIPLVTKLPPLVEGDVHGKI